MGKKIKILEKSGIKKGFSKEEEENPYIKKIKEI